MAYSELIKNFDNIRSYMRDFFIYGFKTREEYDKKAPAATTMSAAGSRATWENCYHSAKPLPGRRPSSLWRGKVPLTIRCTGHSSPKVLPTKTLRCILS